MKKMYTIFPALFYLFTAAAQTSITAVNTAVSSSGSSFTYSSSPNTYNWSASPNNATMMVNGFTAGGLQYSYASTLTGSVKLRRVNNPVVTGNYTLVWAEYINGTNTFNMLPAYQNDMETFFNTRTYNKGTDNFFDNTSSNSNNIERFDWILNSSYSTSQPGKIGFAVFERGAAGAHDPFCIAAITALDASGNPSAYSNIVRVGAAGYGDPGPSVTYRILKAPYPSNLLDAGSNTQTRGGVIISLQNLGIIANQPIYGYSLFSNDLPLTATPANLVNFNNSTFFPTNTGNPGGIDLVAVTGIYMESTVLPVQFRAFSAVENDGVVNLNWTVEDEKGTEGYEAERSSDGRRFVPVCQVAKSNMTGTIRYHCTDNIGSLAGEVFYYRIKEKADNGAVSYSKTIAVKRSAGKQNVLLYPNPATDNLFVTVHRQQAGMAEITVYNAAGISVSSNKIYLPAGNNSFTVCCIGQLAKGVYQLTIRSDDQETVRQRFIKQ